MFKKSKSIFIFLFLLIFAFGITFSLTSFSSFNLNLPVSSTSSKVKKKRQAPSSSPTEVEWNAHMVKIKPVLQILVGFKKETIIFKIGSQGAKTEYSVTNLIKAQNIDAKYSAMSPEAQTELKLLHADGIDNEKLTTAYKTELDNFFASIKSYLDVLKDIKNTIFNGYYIDELVKNLDKKGSELTSTAKVEFIELWANDLNATYLSAIYKKTLDDPFLKGIKSSLQVFKAMGRTWFLILGRGGIFQIGNLITVLDKKDWETNVVASKELSALYKYNSDALIIIDKLQAEYEVFLHPFLAKIKSVLQVFKTMGSTEVTMDATIYPIDNLITAFETLYWKTNILASQELGALYKYNSDAQIVVKKLEVAYKLELNLFLNGIKPALQVLKAYGTVSVKIDNVDIAFPIRNLIATFETSDWETNISASKELIALYKHNPDHSVVKKELQTVYKKELISFINGIKPALQVFKTMGSTEITIGRVSSPFSIRNLITVFETSDWETDVAACKELIALYQYNSNSSIVRQELEVAYELLLDTFLAGIKPALLVLKVMGSSEVIITGKSYSISNLITILYKNNWKTNKLAGEELVNLYKYNPNHSVVKKELQAIYKLKLGPFLKSIRPALLVLKVMGESSQLLIGVGIFKVGNLNNVLDKNDWETNIDASKELGYLYKYNLDHLMVDFIKIDLQATYKVKLEPFLIGIKSVLQVLKTIGSTEVTIGGFIYKIGHLITVLDKNDWETNIDAIKELAALYKYNPNHKVVNKHLQVAYKLKLGPFLIGIKSALQVFKIIGSTEVTMDTTIYPIDNLITAFETLYWKPNIPASQELATLYKHNSNHSVVEKELQTAYKVKLEPFLMGIKPALQVLKAMGSIEVTTDGKDTPFQISNLIKVLETVNWETNILASQELATLYKHDSNYRKVKRELEFAYKLPLKIFLEGIKPVLLKLKILQISEITISGTTYKIGNLITILETDDWETNTDASKELGFLYKYNSDHSVVEKELEVAYELLLDTFLIGIKPALQVLKTMGSSEVIINDKSYSISNLITVLKTGDWKTNKLARAELINLYKHNPDHSVVKKELQTVYKKELISFINGIKPALQVFKIMGSTEVTIGGTNYEIAHLITILETDDWETNIDASKELGFLYKHNSDHSVVNKELQTAYKNILNNFLTSIKPALQVLKVMGNTEITIDGTIYPISDLITVFEIGSWETNIDASKELGVLYGIDSDHLIVKTKLIVAYKKILGSFWGNIKSTLRVFNAIGSTEVIIAGELKPFPISNLITVLDKNDWEINIDASKELGALYKHNSDASIITVKLQTVYKNILNNFLTGIKLALQVLKVMGSTEVIIGGKPYLISNLITVLDKNDWKKDVVASKELGFLYKHNSNHSVVEKELQTAYKVKLGPFLTGIKPTLKVFETMGNTEVTIDRTAYKIGNLITVLDKNDWETNIDASKELGFLYKHNSDALIIIGKLQTAYKNILNNFLTGIKPTLQVLKAMGSTEVIIAGEPKPFPISNLITVLDKNDWEINIDASKELGVLYGIDSDHSVVKTKLIVAYKKILGSFWGNIKSTLRVFNAIGSTEVIIAGELKPFPISNLITVLDKNDWEINIDASKELGALYKHNSDASIIIGKLQTAYKNILNNFLTGIKLALQVLKVMGSTEVIIAGEPKPFPISNLITVLDKNDWEINIDASKELGFLYKHNSNHSVVEKELQTAYKNILNNFLTGIKPALQVLKAMGSTEVIIAGELKSFPISNLITVLDKNDWEINIDASKELGFLYKHNSDASIIIGKLQTVYKNILNNFLTGIKPALQVLKAMGSTEVIIAGELKPFPISNLITVLEANDWETNSFASTELYVLYKHNSNFQTVKEWLQTAYKNILNTFLLDIKSALQVFKTMGSNQITIAGLNGGVFQIGGLIKVLEMANWEKDVPASQELGALYKYNSDGSKVLSKLITTYKNILDPFLAWIKVHLQFFKTIGRIQIKITDELDPFPVGNLVNVLEIDNWEMDVPASKELSALYKYNSDGSKVLNKLITVYQAILDPFLADIKSALQVFKAMGSTEITIPGEPKPFPIGYLISVLKTTNWGVNHFASKELGALYKHNSVSQTVKEQLENVYKKILDPFLADIKPTLQVLKTIGIDKSVIFSQQSYPIGNLVNVLETSNWETNVPVSKELGALYKYNSDASIITDRLQTDYKTVLSSFFANITPDLQNFKAMGRTDVTITDELDPFPIGNLINVLDKNDWEKDVVASQELATLYKYNSDALTIIKKLQIAYVELWDSFLNIIEPTLQKFAVNKITEVWIDKKHYLIGDLILPYKYSADAQKIKEKLDNFLATKINTKKILAFQKNWDEGKVSSYLLWLSLFDIEKVKLSQNQVVPVEALAIAIQTMLSVEKFDFTKLQEKARKQLLNLLDVQGRIRAEKTFQDDVWKQIKNHQKWKAIEGSLGKLVLQSIKTLLLEVQDLGINKVSHPFFPRGYDLSFLKDNLKWDKISFQNLLQGMKVAVNGTHIEFYSHLFPNQIVFQVPMKKLSTVFSEITITNIIKSLEKVVSDHFQQERKLETKNKGLIIGLSVAGGVLFLVALSSFLYWFFKVKK